MIFSNKISKILFTLVILFSWSCSECGNVECISASPYLQFEFVYKDSGESYFHEDAFLPPRLSITDLTDGSEVEYDYIVANYGKFFQVKDLNWRTGTVYYNVNIDDEIIFDLELTYGTREDPCCTYTILGDIQTDSLEYKIASPFGSIQFLIEEPS